jgi:F0F1-type ATP synthase assembly protein I
MYLLLKFGLSAALIVAVAEIAKRSTLLGAVIASLPLTSVLAMIWLYQDTKDAQRVADLSGEIFWLVLPSLLLFIVLPLLIRRGMSFYPALGIACACTVIGYALMSFVLHRFGVKI